MFLDRHLSEKDASRFIEPREAIEASFSGERKQSLGETFKATGENRGYGLNSVFMATAGNVFHVLVTDRAIRVISTNPQSGKPSQVVLEQPRNERLGSMAGRNGRVLELDGLALKLSRKDAAVAAPYASPSAS